MPMYGVNRKFMIYKQLLGYKRVKFRGSTVNLNDAKL